MRRACATVLCHCRDRRSPGGREKYPERASLPGPALDQEAALMAVDDVLDDGEAEPGAAPLPAALHVHAIEALGQARHRGLGDALAVVADAGDEHRLGSASGAGGAELEAHPDMSALAAVFDRV